MKYLLSHEDNCTSVCTPFLSARIPVCDTHRSSAYLRSRAAVTCSLCKKFFSVCVRATHWIHPLDAEARTALHMPAFFARKFSPSDVELLDLVDSTVMNETKFTR